MDRGSVERETHSLRIRTPGPVGVAQAVLRQPASASAQERGDLGPQDTHHPPLFKLRPQAIEDLVFPWFIHPRGQYSVHIAQGMSSAQYSGWAGGPQNGWRGQKGLGLGGSPCHLLLWATLILFSLQAAIREVDSSDGITWN